MCDPLSMTRSRGPGNLVARRPMTVARVDADAHDSYAAMIENDLGGRQRSYRALDEGLPPSALALMVRPLALFLFACIAFLVVLTLWLWQAGAFGKLRIGERPPLPQLSASWMGARQRAPTVPPSVAKVPTPDIPATKPPEPKPEPEPTPAGEERSPEPARAADENTAE
jgi:hypothetical protein